MAPIDLTGTADGRAKIFNLFGKIEHGIPP
jgi:hypothetical protein